MPIVTDGAIIGADALGQNNATPTADDLSDVTTTSAQAKVRLLLARLAANAFSATIQGAARTELDVMLGQLATYLAALGAAYSATVNPGGTAKTNLEETLEDLGEMLAGTAGIVTFPIGAAPANAVSLAEVLRYVSDNVGLEGATALANKLTAARAALLDQITALRMAELDAANIPADVDTLLARLTALRAGYLDNLSGGAVALAASWTAALATALGSYTAIRAGYLDNINQAGLLQVTAARAALLDQMTALRMAELDAANLPANIDAILADTGTDGVVVSSRTAAYGRGVGVKQILEVSVTSAANAGDVTLATVTTQPCLIKSVVVHADTAAQADLTSAAVAGGAAKVVTFLSATDAAVANLNAVDEQVAWTGAVRFAATKTIVISLVGTGVTPVDLTVTIEYESCVAGGYLA